MLLSLPSVAEAPLGTISEAALLAADDKPWFDEDAEEEDEALISSLQGRVLCIAALGRPKDAFRGARFVIADEEKALAQVASAIVPTARHVQGAMLTSCYAAFPSVIKSLGS